ncbi:MAG: nitronate monooxygenase [Alphaproteobacteria bacterium]|nr:nitronate monooxygenase [Alphaproteobacteria bacterium]
MGHLRDVLKRSPLCRLLGVELPIVQAGMGGVALGKLAAAVSNAGGLGTIGAGIMPADELAREIAVAQAATAKPVGVNLLFPKAAGDDPTSIKFRALFEDQLAVVMASGLKILVSGLGDPSEVIPEAHRRGMVVLSVVGNVRQASTLSAAGVDAIIAQGLDGGGHVGRVGTAVLVPAVTRAVSVPVLAAGGIADGRGIVAALAWGASGIWIGTRFLASTEAAVADSYKAAIVAADDEGTVVTRANTGKTSRLIKNAFTDRWALAEAAIKSYPQQMEEVGFDATDRGIKGIDPATSAMPAGQSVALIGDVKPAAQIVEDLIEEAERAFAATFR